MNGPETAEDILVMIEEESAPEDAPDDAECVPVDEAVRRWERYAHRSDWT